MRFLLKKLSTQKRFCREILEKIWNNWITALFLQPIRTECIGLPDSIMVVRLFLVQFVLVRIQVGQLKKIKTAEISAVFLYPYHSLAHFV